MRDSCRWFWADRVSGRPTFFVQAGGPHARLQLPGMHHENRKRPRRNIGQPNRLRVADCPGGQVCRASAETCWLRQGSAPPVASVLPEQILADATAMTPAVV